jgi:formylglycine-generating enzyme required for sulfatase activity
MSDPQIIAAIILTVGAVAAAIIGYRAATDAARIAKEKEDDNQQHKAEALTRQQREAEALARQKREAEDLARQQPPPAATPPPALPLVQQPSPHRPTPPSPGPRAKTAFRWGKQEVWTLSSLVLLAIERWDEALQMFEKGAWDEWLAEGLSEQKLKEVAQKLRQESSPQLGLILFLSQPQIMELLDEEEHQALSRRAEEEGRQLLRRFDPEIGKQVETALERICPESSLLWQVRPTAVSLPWGQQDLWTMNSLVALALEQWGEATQMFEEGAWDAWLVDGVGDRALLRVAQNLRKAGEGRPGAGLLQFLQQPQIMALLSEEEKDRLHQREEWEKGRIWPKDGKEQVFVPGGPFTMGSNDYDDEKPVHTVTVGDFWIDKTPVTNAEYKRFLDANPKHRVPYVKEDWAKPYNWDQKKRTYPAGKENHPVVLVSWDDAMAYAAWAGKRLLTEAEWEKAARGTDGRKYPWGNDAPTRQHANFNENEGGTTPVGKYSPVGDSPYGCVDMAGNMWEWTGSEYKGYPYDADDGRENVDKTDVLRSVRGGSWYNIGGLIRAANRYLYIPGFRNLDLGVRCSGGEAASGVVF